MMDLVEGVKFFCYYIIIGMTMTVFIKDNFMFARTQKKYFHKTFFLYGQ